MSIDMPAVVLAREEVLPGIVRITMEAGDEFLEEAAPGRFIQVEAPGGIFPVLRRPFTLHRVEDGAFSILFRVKGRGTRKISEVSSGDTLRVLGPLGRGYRLAGGRWLLVGGGLGAAGFPFLAARIESGTALLGASSSDDLPDAGVADTRVATEDGSVGIRGLVTDLLPDVDWHEYSNVALCGPVAMMKAVIKAVPPGIRERIQVSTEARMGCGWGACECCSIPAAAGGYFKCCTAGPVVPAGDIDWSRWEETD